MNPSILEIVALLMAGLGFFFVGLGTLKVHLRQLASRRVRNILAGWLRVPD